MSLNSCLEALIGLSNSDLATLQAKVQEEAQNRVKRRFMSLLENWAAGDPTGTSRSVMYTAHQFTQGGWLVILMVFHGTDFETFRARSRDKESAEQLAAECAVRLSKILTNSLPVQPMEIMI